MNGECVCGERRDNAQQRLNMLKADYYAILDGDAQEFIDYLWHRRHVHWTVAEVEMLERIAGLFLAPTKQ